MDPRILAALRRRWTPRSFPGARLEGLFDAARPGCIQFSAGAVSKAIDLSGNGRDWTPAGTTPLYSATGFNNRPALLSTAVDSRMVFTEYSGSLLNVVRNSTTFDGTIPAAYVERRGLSLDQPEILKLVRGVRPRILGNPGETVTVRVGGADDPYADPTYGAPMTHVIGQTVANDCMVTARYPAVRIESGTAYQWRLDSYDLDIEPAGSW